jgi:hypothetical protein
MLIEDRYRETSKEDDIESLKKKIDVFIERKAKFGMGRGIKIIIENSSLVLMLISASLKANIISLVYAVCCIIFLIKKRKSIPMILNIIVIGLAITI